MQNTRSKILTNKKIQGEMTFPIRITHFNNNNKLTSMKIAVT